MTQSQTRFTLEDINKIKMKGFDMKLPENTIVMVNKLAQLVGSPEYVRTPVFKKRISNANPNYEAGPRRGEKFGEIKVHLEGDSVPEEFSNLINLISERLSVTLESARLFEDVQRRATQEQITGEITARIRESLDIDSVIRTATQEIGERLGLDNLSIQLDLNSENHPER